MSTALLQPGLQDSRVVNVSPEMAAAWLKAINQESQRKLRMNHVLLLTREMEEGRWVDNGDSIKFDANGDLIDGQHRLWGVVRSGMTISMRVVSGIITEAIHTLDTGIIRTVPDVLKLRGYKNANLLASMTRLCICYQSKAPATNFHIKWGTGRSLDFVAKHYDRLSIGAKAAMSMKKRLPGVVGGQVGWLAYEVLDVPGYQQFLDALQHGADDAAHPAVVFRERMIRSKQPAAIHKLSTLNKWAILIKCWNAYLIGDGLTRCPTWKRSGYNSAPFPRLMITDPD